MHAPRSEAAPERAFERSLGCWCALPVAIVLLSACRAEERIVSARGGLFGLPGAQTSLPIENADANAPAQAAAKSPWDSVLSTFPGYQPPPAEEPASASGPPAAPATRALRHTNTDGSVTLSLRSPAEVMYQVMMTLQNHEHDLLLDQVIAERTKLEYRRRGRDPGEAVDFLVKHQDDVGALFATFPMADQTPGVHLESIGRNAFRLRAPVAMAQELRLHSFEVVIEQGRFRLLMIR